MRLTRRRDDDMTNILLLGGTGFIGQAMARELLASMPDARIVLLGRSPKSNLECRIGNPRLLVKAQRMTSATDFETVVANMDIVVHLISSTVPATSGVDYGREMEDLSLTAKLLEACVAEKVRRFVFVSSAGSIYGNTLNTPATEDTPCMPLSFYAYQKLAIEELVSFFGRTRNLNYCIARLSNPFGPGQNPNIGQGVVSTFLNRALEDKGITIRGDGSATRDFIYISDAAKALCTLATKETQHSIYNVGSGASQSISTVVECIERAIARPLKVTFAPASSIEVVSSDISVKRYTDEFGKIDRVPFSEGVKRTLDYLKKAQDNR